MKFITKEFINSLIQEQLELTEMPRNLLWADLEGEDPVTVNIDSIKGIPVNAIDPDTNKPLEPGVVKANVVRQSPTGYRMINFTNVEEGGKRVTRYVILDDQNNPLYGEIYLPRATKYGTEWTGTDLEKLAKQRVTRLQRKQSTYGHNPEDDLQVQNQVPEVEARLNERWAKGKLVNPLFNSFFKQPAIIKHLDSCGIPEVRGGAKFTEPTTNILRKYSYNGPRLQFNYHSVRDDNDVQDALDKIMKFRMAQFTGEKMQGKRPEPTKMVRQYGGNVYSGGAWDSSQRALGKDEFKLTPIYKLYMKNVQRGEMAFNVITDLDVIGDVVGNNYLMTMSFSATKSFRPADTEEGQSQTPKRGNLFDPIRVSKTVPLPDGDVTPTVREHTEFFKELFEQTLSELGNKLLEIDPDDVLMQLQFEPDEVITTQATQQNN